MRLTPESTLELNRVVEEALAKAFGKKTAYVLVTAIQVEDKEGTDVELVTNLVRQDMAAQLMAYGIEVVENPEGSFVTGDAPAEN